MPTGRPAWLRGCPPATHCRRRAELGPLRRVILLTTCLRYAVARTGSKCSGVSGRRRLPSLRPSGCNCRRPSADAASEPGARECGRRLARGRPGPPTLPTSAHVLCGPCPHMPSGRRSPASCRFGGGPSGPLTLPCGDHAVASWRGGCTTPSAPIEPRPRRSPWSSVRARGAAAPRCAICLANMQPLLWPRRPGCAFFSAWPVPRAHGAVQLRRPCVARPAQRDVRVLARVFAPSPTPSTPHLLDAPSSTLAGPLLVASRRPVGPKCIIPRCAPPRTHT